MEMLLLRSQSRQTMLCINLLPISLLCANHFSVPLLICDGLE